MSTSEFFSIAMVDSIPIELMPKRLVSSFARLSPRVLESQRFHTLLLTMEEPSDSHTQISKSTTQSSSTLPPRRLMVLSSSSMELK